MGLGAMKYAWQRQTKDFAHTKGDQYSSLIIDNRGMGESDKPRSRYSTSEMAKDVVELVDHIGWTSKRDLHIIGISMGGMIAQEVVRPSKSPGSSLCRQCTMLCSWSCLLADARMLHRPINHCTSAKGIKHMHNLLKFQPPIHVPLRSAPTPPIFPNHPQISALPAHAI